MVSREEWAEQQRLMKERPLVKSKIDPKTTAKIIALICEEYTISFKKLEADIMAFPEITDEQKKELLKHLEGYMGEVE